jgi:hypothetical protein
MRFFGEEDRIGTGNGRHRSLRTGNFNGIAGPPEVSGMLTTPPHRRWGRYPHGFLGEYEPDPTFRVIEIVPGFVAYPPGRCFHRLTVGECVGERIRGEFVKNEDGGELSDERTDCTGDIDSVIVHMIGEL